MPKRGVRTTPKKAVRKRESSRDKKEHVSQPSESNDQGLVGRLVALSDWPYVTLEGLGGSFSLVFVAVEIDSFSSTYEMLRHLVLSRSELSLYLSAHGFSLLFILRGQLARATWASERVLERLQKTTETKGALALGFGALDTVPRRLHWTNEVSEDDGRLIVDKTCGNKEQLDKALSRGAGIYYDHRKAKEHLFLVFIRSRHQMTADQWQATVDLITRHWLKISDRLAVRDVFDLTNTSQKVNLYPSKSSATTSQKHFRHNQIWQGEAAYPILERIKLYRDGGIGMVVAIQCEAQHLAYDALNDWRNALRDELRAKLDDVYPEFEFLPIDIIQEGFDYSTTGESWHKFLLSERRISPEDFIDFGKIIEPVDLPMLTPPTDFDLKMPVWNWIVIGGPRSGKSSAACCLLSSFFRSGYSIVYLNFKENGGAAASGPKKSELLILLSGIAEPVYCRQENHLKDLIEGIPQFVVYVEVDGKSYKRGRPKCEKLFEDLSTHSKLVICLDEALNYISNGDDPFIKAYHSRANMARDDKRYFVWIHQQLGDVPHKITDWDQNYSYLFAGPQSTDDGSAEAYATLKKRSKGPEFLSGLIEKKESTDFPKYLNTGQAVAMVHATGLISPLRIALPPVTESDIRYFEKRRLTLKQNATKWNGETVVAADFE